MGRELQKRKRRSSRPTVRQPSSRTSTKRLKNPLGNDIIARNWNKNETTTQNYRRLGLVGRLNTPTGGVEPNRQAKDAKKSTNPADPFAILPMGADGVVSEARVERDENGKIVRIIREGRKGRENPLNDPLNALDTDSEAESKIEDDGETWGGIDEKEDSRTDVVKALEAEANRPREKKIRGQSQREREWLDSLVEKYGADTRAMARDRKLNPMQQTEPDIAKRIRKLKGAA
ncbi:ribosome biogenesis protein Nop16 [Xylariales sp. AK1849]|nr:ribosome biogenesis protein Nop16 [Xylariales sp. AK1849]